MDKRELIQFLKENMKVCINNDWQSWNNNAVAITVPIHIGDEKNL